MLVGEFGSPLRAETDSCIHTARLCGSAAPRETLPLNMSQVAILFLSCGLRLRQRVVVSADFEHPYL